MHKETMEQMIKSYLEKSLVRYIVTSGIGLRLCKEKGPSKRIFVTKHIVPTIPNIFFQRCRISPPQISILIDVPWDFLELYRIVWGLLRANWV